MLKMLKSVESILADKISKRMLCFKKITCLFLNLLKLNSLTKINSGELNIVVTKNPALFKGTNCII